MKTTTLVLGALLLAGCGGYPPPHEPMAQTEAAAGAAVGANAKDSPQAALHLKLAQEEIAQAKRLMEDGDNKRAEYVLVRAKADADLSLALAKENNAQQEAQRVSDQIKAAQQQ
jgi:hypothetical protein